MMTYMHYPYKESLHKLVEVYFMMKKKYLEYSF